MSSSPYLSLLAASIGQGRDGVSAMIDDGITEDYFPAGSASHVAFEAIVTFVRSHQGYPDRRTVEGLTGVDVGPTPSEPLDFWLQKVRELRLHGQLVDAHRKIGQALDQGETDDAFQFFESSIVDVYDAEIVPARTVGLFDLAEEVQERYEAIKAGLRGIPFPWPSLNEATLGMWPEDLILIAARTGVGKSTAVALMALHAWSWGHSVLFTTTELSQRVIAQRMFAMHLGLRYSDLYRGRMDIFSEKKLVDLVKNPPPDAGNFKVTGGGFDLRLDTLSLAIQDARPDLVIADGAYLLAAQGRTRTERAAEGFNELKRLAKRHKVALVTTTQFNRQANSAKEETLTLSNIGLTDAAGWNSDLVFALHQTPDMHSDKLMRILNLKGREALVPDVLANWDFDLMDFSEISRAGGGDADEFGIVDDEDLPF